MTKQTLETIVEFLYKYKGLYPKFIRDYFNLKLDEINEKQNGNR